MGGGTEGRGGEVPPIPGGDDDDDGVSEEKGAEEIGAVFVLQVMMNILGLYVGLVGIRR